MCNFSVWSGIGSHRVYVCLVREWKQILSTVYLTLSIEVNFGTYYQLEPVCFSFGNILDVISIKESKVQCRSGVSWNVWLMHDEFIE